MAWCRVCEQLNNNTETRCLGCWGSCTRWRIYCNKRESQGFGAAGRQWNRGLLTVRDSWLLGWGTGASGKGRAQTKNTSKECSSIFWRSPDPSCCDWGWLCRTQNSLRSQTRWQLGTVAPANEGQVQGTPRQQDLEHSENTHREEHRTGKMGLSSELKTQWSSQQIQSTLCGKRFQTGGLTGLLRDFWAYL